MFQSKDLIRHERKAKNFCYGCGVPYVKGHNCAGRNKALVHTISNEEEKGCNLDNEEVNQESAEEEPAEMDMINVTLCAMENKAICHTIKVPGLAKKRKFSVLIDSGSSYSFIDPKFVKLLTEHKFLINS